MLVIDGEIRIHGRYPTREDLQAALAGEPAQAEAASSSGCGCSPDAGC